MVSDIEELTSRLRAAQDQEKRTFDIAVDALSAAIYAKNNAMLAWVDLAKGRGSTDEFRKTYREAHALADRAANKGDCAEFVKRALEVTLSDRLGF